MFTVARIRQSGQDRSGERSPLQPGRHQTPSYGTGPPSYEPLPYPGGGHQTYQAHPSPQDSSPPRFKMNTVTTVRLIFLVVLTQAVAFILSYHLPTKYGEYSRAASRMHDQECAMRREAAHLEDERIVHQGESDRLEKERLALESATHRSEQESLRLEQDKKLMEDERLMLEQEKEEWKKERGRWEKSREDRVPQGAFWASLWPAPDCRAYGRREYWGILESIPEDWTDMEACTNMPAEIKGVYVRRPDRCGYVEGSSHIHGFWMVDQDEVDCKPWHADATDKVGLGQPARFHLSSRTSISRAAPTADLVLVALKPGSWVSTINLNKTGVCCARARLLLGITSRTKAPVIVWKA